MTLQEWLNEGGRKQRWLAEKLGCHVITAGRWVRGESTPDARYREAIEKLTGGQVPASQWKEESDAR